MIFFIYLFESVIKDRESINNKKSEEEEEEEKEKA